MDDGGDFFSSWKRQKNEDSTHIMHDSTQDLYWKKKLIIINFFRSLASIGSQQRGSEPSAG